MWYELHSNPKSPLKTMSCYLQVWPATPLPIGDRPCKRGQDSILQIVSASLESYETKSGMESLSLRLSLYISAMSSVYQASLSLAPRPRGASKQPGYDHRQYIPKVYTIYGTTLSFRVHFVSLLLYLVIGSLKTILFHILSLPTKTLHCLDHLEFQML